MSALDVRQDSALPLSCTNGHTRTVRQLVWHGADPWQRNSLDLMPIDVAEKYGHRESYYFLEHVVGEKCVFDRLPDAMFTRGLRHADTPIELYHRADVAELLSRDSLTQSARRQKKLVLQDLAVELQQTKQALADLAAASCEATEEAPCRASTIRLASW